MSLKYYPKAFVTPLLAQAFKEGIDFVGDPDYRATGPKKEGTSAGNRWVIIVEHDDNDDEDDELLADSVTQSKRPIVTLQDFEERLKSMKPISAQSSPVKITADDPIEPCGHCIPCSQKQDCINVINAACAAMESIER